MSYSKQIHTTQLCTALSLLKQSNHCSWESYSSLLETGCTNVLLASIFLNWQTPPTLWTAPLPSNHSARWLCRSMIIVPQNVLGKTDSNVLHQTLPEAEFCMLHIKPSQFINTVFKSVCYSIQQFTAVWFYLSLKAFSRGQMPNLQGYYEGILELGKKMGLTGLNGPLNSKNSQFQLVTTPIFLNGICMIVTSFLKFIRRKFWMGWLLRCFLIAMDKKL